MVHTATLVHDDIIDGADLRRGRPSANTTWGNEKCVLAGDWLYMRAFREAMLEKDLNILDLLIGLTQKMVEGELLQIQKLGKAVSEAEYYDLIDRKTACLFAVSMRLGAVLAGASEADEASLAAYGKAVGLAFQIVDDVLDLTATEEVLGKPVASDLREGKATLAVIHSMDHGTAADRQTHPASSGRPQLRACDAGADSEDPEAQRLGGIRHGRSRPPRQAIPRSPSLPCPTRSSSAPCCGWRILWWRGTSSRLRRPARPFPDGRQSSSRAACSARWSTAA